MEEKSHNEIVCWYVMRSVACGCHKSIRTTLEQDSVEFFQPMHNILRYRNNKPYKSFEPLISNLFFVRGSKAALLPYTGEKCKHFQFYYNRCSGKQADCLSVPDKQMEDFRRVYEQTIDNPQIFSPSELDLKKGQRIRIIGGAFDGVEGTFQRVKGHRSRQLIVTIDGIISITAAVSPEFVEVIE